MLIGNQDITKKAFIVAEIGNNHEGDFELAKELISAAKESGANAVKFQTIIPEGLVSIQEVKRIDQLKKFAFTRDQFKELSEFADSKKITFLSTAFCEESFKWIEDLVPAYKVSSGDNNFYQLLRIISRKGKPIFLSTGLADVRQIKLSLAIIEDESKRFNITPQIVLLHCVSAYPTQINQANLLAIQKLKEQFNINVGYSDHTIGIDAALIAYVLGANLIEKHFTISKTHSEFRDHQLSADPNDLKNLVKKIREAELYLGVGEKKLQTDEIKISNSLRRSITASRDIEKGKILVFEDLDWVRPGDGIQPGEEHLLLGKRVIKRIKKGTQINTEALD